MVRYCDVCYWIYFCEGCMKIFKVLHECFQTDRTGSTSSLVLANTAKEALNIYNDIAKDRKEYPYMWNILKDERDIYEVEFLNGPKIERPKCTKISTHNGTETRHYDDGTKKVWK